MHRKLTFAVMAPERIIGRWRALSGRGERGQAVVELAVLLSVLITLALGATDFARGVGQYMQVVNAANAGAQYGALGATQYNDTPGITSAATNDLGSLYNQPGASVKVTKKDDDGSKFQQVSVTVTVPYHMITPFAGAFLPSFNLTSTAVMRVDPFNG